MNRKPSFSVDDTWTIDHSHANRDKDVLDFLTRWEQIINEPYMQPTLSEYQDELIEELLMFIEDELVDGKTNKEILQNSTFIKFYTRSIELNIPFIKIIETIHIAQSNAKKQFIDTFTNAKDAINRLELFNLIKDFARTQHKHFYSSNEVNVISLEYYLINKYF
jgi:hypothetical protein